MAGRARPWRAAAAAGVILPCNSSSPQNSEAMQSTRGRSLTVGVGLYRDLWMRLSTSQWVMSFLLPGFSKNLGF